MAKAPTLKLPKRVYVGRMPNLDSAWVGIRYGPVVTAQVWLGLRLIRIGCWLLGVRCELTRKEADA